MSVPIPLSSSSLVTAPNAPDDVTFMALALAQAEAALVVGEDHNAFHNAFEAMWAVFWLVTTLGYDGPLGSGSASSRVVVALALLCGLLR